MPRFVAGIFASLMPAPGRPRSILRPSGCDRASEAQSSSTGINISSGVSDPCMPINRDS